MWWTQGTLFEVPTPADARKYFAEIMSGGLAQGMGHTLEIDFLDFSFLQVGVLHKPPQSATLRVSVAVNRQSYSFVVSSRSKEKKSTLVYCFSPFVVLWLTLVAAFLRLDRCQSSERRWRRSLRSSVGSERRRLKQEWLWSSA